MSVPAEPKDKPIQVKLEFSPHEGQAQYLACKFRFISLVTGVRWGKTKGVAFKIASRAAANRNHHYWGCAPTYKMLDVLEREYRKMVQPASAFWRYNVKDRRYTWKSGSLVEFRSLEWPDSCRGPGLNGVGIDEAAYVKEEAARIIRTRVSDTRGWIDTITTPKGKDWNWRRWMKGRSNRPDNHASFHFESRDNPYFPLEEWDDAKRDLPEDFFRQEYMAQFLDEQAGVFRQVDRVVAAGQTQLVGEAIGPFTLGLDLAKYKDWTVIVVMDARGRAIDFTRMNKLSWVAQKEEVIRIAKKWGAVIWMDSTGLGDPIADELMEVLGAERVMGVKFTVESKRQMVQALQSAIERQSIELPDIEVMVEELKWFEYKAMPGGSLRYQAPRGFNCDCVWSVALANWGRLKGAAVGEAVMLDRLPEDTSGTDLTLVTGRNANSEPSPIRSRGGGRRRTWGRMGW